MAVKTLNKVRSLGATIPASQSRTYSIAPSMTSSSERATKPHLVEMESSLQDENPLGCIRGVMWVMAFNLAALFLGIAIWQSCKLLW
jgi:hypothetical protein